MAEHVIQSDQSLAPYVSPRFVNAGDGAVLYKRGSLSFTALAAISETGVRRLKILANTATRFCICHVYGMVRRTKVGLNCIFETLHFVIKIYEMLGKAAPWLSFLGPFIYAKHGTFFCSSQIFPRVSL